jgi:2-polyprenyl-3-methyl-5-hydroxy-6-metoxy-1,4-benzoquinol methylase
MNKTAAFEQASTIEKWDRDYYHPIAERYYDRAIPAMLCLMGVSKGATILDAGCGPGVHSIRAAGAGCQVIAIDVSEAMLREAQSRVAAAGVAPAVEFRQEDLTKLSFPDGSFRHVFSWGVVIHIPEIEKALDELCRIIATKGSLALYVTNRNSWDQMFERVARFVLRKPIISERFPLGSGSWFGLSGERIWVWQFNIPELIREIETRGMKCTYRSIGELSSLQRHFKWPLRDALLVLNNLCYRIGFSPVGAHTNLLVFAKK